MPTLTPPVAREVPYPGTDSSRPFGDVLRSALTARDDTCDWDRDKVVAQLRSMEDEMPFDVGAIRLLAATLDAQANTVRELVPAGTTAATLVR